MIDDRAERDVPWWCPNPGGRPTIELRRCRIVAAFCSACEFAVELRRG
jgi:hypothetical protein